MGSNIYKLLVMLFVVVSANEFEEFTGDFYPMYTSKDEGLECVKLTLEVKEVSSCQCFGESTTRALMKFDGNTTGIVCYVTVLESDEVGRLLNERCPCNKVKQRALIKKLDDNYFLFHLRTPPSSFNLYYDNWYTILFSKRQVPVAELRDYIADIKEFNDSNGTVLCSF